MSLGATEFFPTYSLKMSQDNDKGHSFCLYDLHVEVICPPNKRIMCGAKEGDYFTLKGEMLYLPPKQGMSIYSIGTYKRIEIYPLKLRTY
jgi:hypothetical protein